MMLGKRFLRTQFCFHHTGYLKSQAKELKRPAQGWQKKKTLKLKITINSYEKIMKTCLARKSHVDNKFKTYKTFSKDYLICRLLNLYWTFQIILPTRKLMMFHIYFLH